MTMTLSDQQLFSGGLRPFPGIPAEWAPAQRLLAEDILSDVRALFPGWSDEVDPEGDVEDFWEDACRVSAAWRATDGNVVAKDPASWRTEPWTADEMARRFGPIARDEEGGHHGADRLINHPLVKKHGGREMLLGGFGEGVESDVVEWMAARHREHGIRRGILKAVARKNGVWSIELDSDPEVIRRRMVDAMDWTYMRLEEGQQTVLAQDAIDLQFEYRLFVVDGEVISGAGCVEEFTPLNRPVDAGLFDMRVRRVRGYFDTEPTAVEVRPDVVGRLIEFGRTVAREHGGTVVIDVALDVTGNAFGVPVVIEFNDIPNSGLYASNPWVVAEALLGARDRGYAI